jgi:hypothetical protein
MPVHLGAVNLEALGELDVGLGNQLLQVRLALDQRQLPQVVAVEIEQTVVPSAEGTTTSPSMIAEPALIR